MSNLDRSPIEGVVVDDERTSLAQAFVECTTEYDFAELPADLQVSLEQWCAAFRAWMAEQS